MSTNDLPQDLRDGLKAFIDPYLRSDYLSARCVQSYQQNAGIMTLTIHLPYPSLLVRENLKSQLLACLVSASANSLVAQTNTYAKLNIVFTDSVAAYQNPNEVKAMNNIKNIIAIGSGKGGVGKSTTAINIAIALVRSGAKVGVLDADIYGPNLGLMLGVDPEQRPQVEAEKYFLPIQAYGLQTMSMSYVTTENTPMVWRGPKASGAFQQLLTATLWHELDYLIVDMPPGTGDIQLTLSQMAPLTAAVVVTTPQNMATQDARKGIEMFKKVNVPILGVIENMSTYVCESCGHETHLFGEGGGETLSAQCGVNYLGDLPLQSDVRIGMDVGKPVMSQTLDHPLCQRYLNIALNICGQLHIMLKPKASAKGINLVEA